MKSSEEIANKFSKVTKPRSLDVDETFEVIGEFFPYLKSLMKIRDDEKFQGMDTFQLVENLLGEDLPQYGENIGELLDVIKEKMIPYFNYENVKFFGYIPRSPTNVSMLGDSLVPFLNQYLGSAIASPSANAIESLALQWIGNIFGYTGDFYGSFTIGGSHANLKGIFVGLVNSLPWDTRELGMIGDRRPVIYTSDQAHLCISKSVHQLGLGSASLKVIPSNDRLQLDVNQLEQQIQKDKNDPDLLPVMIVGTAGTTNTGAVDNFGKLYQISQRYDMWLHVDAAYGGFAILADHPVSEQLKELHLADSIATDTHKWLYTPMEGGLTLVKQSLHLHKAYSGTAEYLEDSRIKDEYRLIRDFSEYGFALSRRWRGLMIWMNFKFYGIEGLKKLITRNILLADYFRQLIREDEDFNLFKHSQLGIVCFKHPDKKVNDFIFDQFMKQGKFLIGRTKVHGEETLRISILNEHMELDHVNAIFENLKEILNTYKVANSVQ